MNEYSSILNEIDYFVNEILMKLSPDEKEKMNHLITHIKNENDYIKALNTCKKPIMADWESSVCPTCGESFDDYEDCNDGYYDRAYSLERCPYCGQKLEWFK